ncbi:MAG: NAD(P)/FAD-dependent oxidoreductase [Hydrocarboniphaga sp.]|uniref:NAD(P)/FAD-dependent oxidoreductase n=1 Tax=Hydrocarboniphaga sp. TaxID=2033016 RepID=UPI00262367D3|nr:NAD(P)/FAD-dependent oxidoreductase [Hydrocarboniphaga sp.]MDB5967771.1 NAD(P)/FAD-dependent oxidoreductase [Hydrocarboniphaga sp.]
MDYDVVVIGGGAAGLFCAFNAGYRGGRVLVIEHANKAGKKILMSGGGRCNFTNLDVRPDRYLSANPHFCKSALARYKPEHFIELVDRHGIAWHEKELGQLFCDASSKQILQMLLAECADAGVRVETGCSVQHVQQREGGFALNTSLGPIQTSKLVIATGGLSIPSMGASGFGYDIARQFGHRIKVTRAGLVPLTLSGTPLEQWQDLSGLSLPVETRCNGASFRNQMLVTHRGLSGPAMLQISSYWEPGQPLQIDLLDGGDALELLKTARRDRPNIELKTALTPPLPKRFAQRFVEVQGCDERPLKQYRDTELAAVAAALSQWPITPNGTEGYRTAEVTLGGVDVDELSSATMESRLVPGLYFIGEVVDVSGWLGGYNFQWAWASAHAAAGVL